MGEATSTEAAGLRTCEARGKGQQRGCGVDGYGCAVYPRGVELHRDGRLRRTVVPGWVDFIPPFRTGGPRGAIRGFTRQSRKRLAWLLANAPIDFAGHATFTYHARVDEADGFKVEARNRALVGRAKADLNRFLAAVRKEVGRYCWIQEFQKRGAIHFHVLFEHAVEERRLALAWCKATDQLHDPHALEHSVRVRVVEDQLAARRYLITYFGKGVQKHLPAGVRRAGRYWGASRSLTVAPLVEVTSCPEKGKKHEWVALRVRRGVQRFVSRELGFNWRGGRLIRWTDELPARVAKVIERLKAFYHDTDYLTALLEKFDWEPADEELEKRRYKLESPAGGKLEWLYEGPGWEGY